MLGSDLDANAVWDDGSLLLESVVVRLDELGESELSGDEDLLSAWELELGSSEGLFGVFDVFGWASEGKEDLTDVDSCRLTKSLTEGTSHTLLESICSSARKHFVDSNDVPWVDSASHVEGLLTAVDGHVLVAGNSCSLKSLRGDLLLLVANQMDASWEFIELSLLLTNVVHSKLGVWDTTVESRLWIWLILLVPVAPRWSSWHLLFKIIIKGSVLFIPTNFDQFQIKHLIFN